MVSTLIRRKVTELFTLHLFKKRFDELSGQCVSIDYLRQSDVYGFFQRGRLVAGFVVRDKPGLWHLDLLEAADIEVGGIRFREDQFCELACLWVSPKVATPAFKMNFYLACVSDAIQTGKPLILGGSPVKEMVSTHQVCLPFILYSGPISVMSREQHWHIYYGTRWSCMKGVAMQFPGRIKDVFKALPGDHHPEKVAERLQGRWHRVTKRLIRR